MAAGVTAEADPVAEGPILIWGAGAIGGTLGAYWARAGHDVLLVDRRSRLDGAVRTTGTSVARTLADFPLPAAHLGRTRTLWMPRIKKRLRRDHPRCSGRGR